MSEDLENDLRQALRAVQPPKDIAALVAARLRTQEPSTAHRQRSWVWPVSLAASVLLVAGYQYQQHRQRISAGLEARRQLIEALHVTNQKLDLAYKAVREQGRKTDERDSGA